MVRRLRAELARRLSRLYATEVPTYQRARGLSCVAVFECDQVGARSWCWCWCCPAGASRVRVDVALGG